jgi:hypothetical protein
LIANRIWKHHHTKDADRDFANFVHGRAMFSVPRSYVPPYVAE